MNTAVHFSSETDLWSTPQDTFDKLNEEFQFATDVCATPENAKCTNYYTKETDGLAQKWEGACWMNPPYGREISKWIAKAHRSAVIDNAIVVSLIPARTDTAWWHDHVIASGAEVRFIRGRLKFGGHSNSAPFPSAIVIFRGKS